MYACASTTTAGVLERGPTLPCRQTQITSQMLGVVGCSHTCVSVRVCGASASSRAHASARRFCGALSVKANWTRKRRAQSGHVNDKTHLAHVTEWTSVGETCSYGHHNPCTHNASSSLRLTFSAIKEAIFSYAASSSSLVCFSSSMLLCTLPKQHNSIVK